MDEKTYKEKEAKGEVEITEQEKVAPDDVSDREKKALEGEISIEELEPLYHLLRSLKRTVSTVPTNTPHSLLEQLVFYESGTTYRLYVYFDDTWRYVVLT